jgi:hypothetical protein
VKFVILCYGKENPACTENIFIPSLCFISAFIFRKYAGIKISNPIPALNVSGLKIVRPYSDAAEKVFSFILIVELRLPSVRSFMFYALHV